VNVKLFKNEYWETWTEIFLKLKHIYQIKNLSFEMFNLVSVFVEVRFQLLHFPPLI